MTASIITFEAGIVAHDLVFTEMYGCRVGTFSRTGPEYATIASVPATVVGRAPAWRAHVA